MKLYVMIPFKKIQKNYTLPYMNEYKSAIYFFRNKILFLFLFLMCLILNGCIPLKTPSHVRQSVGGYDGHKTNIRDIINIDGYFVHTEYENMDSVCFYFMFFDDGMVNMRVHDYSVFPYSKIENIRQYISQVTLDEKGTQAKMFHNSLGWGQYTTVGDTIKVNYHSGWGYPDCYAFETWFKVIDRNHIVDIYSARITKQTALITNNQKKENIYEGAQISVFIPLDKIPSSDCWLKKEKWFWCNELYWKDYMEKIEQKKIE